MLDPISIAIIATSVGITTGGAGFVAWWTFLRETFKLTRADEEQSANLIQDLNLFEGSSSQPSDYEATPRPALPVAPPIMGPRLRSAIPVATTRATSVEHISTTPPRSVTFNTNLNEVRIITTDRVEETTDKLVDKPVRIHGISSTISAGFTPARRKQRNRAINDIAHRVKADKGLLQRTEANELMVKTLVRNAMREALWRPTHISRNLQMCVNLVFTPLIEDIDAQKYRVSYAHKRTQHLHQAPWKSTHYYGRWFGQQSYFRRWFNRYTDLGSWYGLPA